MKTLLIVISIVIAGISQISAEDCQKCPAMCPTNIATVCGKKIADGSFQDFSNYCMLEAENNCPKDGIKNKYAFVRDGSCFENLAYIKKPIYPTCVYPAPAPVA